VLTSPYRAWLTLSQVAASRALLSQAPGARRRRLFASSCGRLHRTGAQG